MEDLKEIKHYQDLTFKALHELILTECKKGNSQLNLNDYKMGSKMKQYLEQKGFVYFVCRSGNWLSW